MNEASFGRIATWLGICALAGPGLAACTSSEAPSSSTAGPSAISASLSAADEGLCLEDVWKAVGGNKQGLQCTAEDIKITELVSATVLDDGCAFPGDTITIDAVFRVQDTNDHRKDIGIYFSEFGGSALRKTEEGGCHAHVLNRAETVDLDALEDDDSGSYCSDALLQPCLTDSDCSSGQSCEERTGEDTCGDMVQGEVTTTVSNLTLRCTDTIDDGLSLLDFSYCSSWRQDGADDLCTTGYAAYPGAPSKCKCDTGVPTDIPIEDPCEDVVCETLECNGPGVCDATRAGQGLSGQELCVYPPLEDGTACSDEGNACTSDTCSGGVCVHTPTPDVACGPTTDCTEDVCVGDQCQTREIANACDDGVVCTSDRCDLQAGTCTNETDDSACDDGVGCTIDACDPQTGCSHEPDDSQCADGIGCTLDSCDPVEGCVVDYDDSACSDGVACTADRCTDEGCAHDADDGGCDDGNVCTTDTCTAEGCVHDDNQLPCADDGDSCTADVCSGGQCTHPDNGHCGGGEDRCETAFAVAASAFCGRDVDGDGRTERRWGWSGELSAGDEITLDVYAGAGQCDLSKGTLVGTLSASYDGETATFDLVGVAGWGFTESHVWASVEPLSTLAPGQWTSLQEYDVRQGSVTHEVSGFDGEDITFAVHAVACTGSDESD